ncbi:MAG: ATP-binding protein [Lachnospiraceae bacterium]|nr:ATP-binding protein [Lachnospiraceae bacterium]
METEYYKRIIDDEIDFRLKTFGAVLITGPKWSGKTTTAEQRAKSIIRFQDPDKIKGYIETAKVKPSLLLNGAYPRLIDEWQIIPSVWDAVRLSVDTEKNKGMYILTGSNSTDGKDNMHTGIGRISRIKMYPMSLYESKDSNGKVSLSEIFNDEKYNFDGVHSELSVEELIFITCRGGLPEAVIARDDDSKLYISKDYINSICISDINTVDGVDRNVLLVRNLLRSYARNVSTIVKKTKLKADLENEFPTLSMPTLDSYLGALAKLYVIDNVEAWNTNIRSKTSVSSLPKRIFTDPSFAVASLGLKPQDFLLDLNTFGFLFENLCIRDLKIYSNHMNGEVGYYRDRTGLEADIVLTIDNNNYALIECKLGSDGIEEGAKHLLKIETLIKEKKIKVPTFKMILTGGNIAYTRKDGVHVVPISCLGP